MGKLYRRINPGQRIFEGRNIFDVKNNLIDIANSFVKVRDLTYAKRGTWILSVDKTAREAGAPMLMDL